MEIKKRWTDTVILTVTEADLREADLREADLREANLYGAKYGDDTLRGIIEIGPIGSRPTRLQIYGIGSSGFIFKTDCFSGNLEEFKTAIETHNKPETIKYYNECTLAIQMALISLPPTEVI